MPFQKKNKYWILRKPYKHSKEAKEKMRLAKLKNPIKYWLGKKRKGEWKLSEENKRNIGLASLGRKHSEETKLKISNTHKGKKLSEEHKKKLSNSHKGVPRFDKRAEKHHNWQGGKSFEKYTLDWTNTLRRAIRERDFYTCQICKEPQGDKAFDVHHIDYDKKNCNSDNLVTLCRSCHQKTSFNRNYWTNYLQAS